jgi:transcription antitermination factor NusG
MFSSSVSLPGVAVSARREARRLRMLVEIKGTDEPRVLADSFGSAGEDPGGRSLVAIPRMRPVWPGIVTSTAEEAAWYALYTRSRFEKKLMSELTDRSIEVFLPMREVLSRWKDRKKRVWLPLFPSYVFVHHVDTPSNRHRILNLPGAVRFVGFNSQTVPVPLEQIEGIRRFLESNLALDPYPYMKIGRRVEVIAGPLKGVQGKLVQKKGKFRFVIQVDLIRQALSVEIDASDVRPL